MPQLLYSVVALYERCVGHFRVLCKTPNLDGGIVIMRGIPVGGLGEGSQPGQGVHKDAGSAKDGYRGADARDPAADARDPEQDIAVEQAGDPDADEIGRASCRERV